MRPPRLSGLADRVSSPAAKAWDVGDLAFEQMRAGRQVIHLGVGDPDLDTAPETIAALTHAAANGRTHYSPIPGEPDLRAAAAQSVRERHGGTVTADHVVICTGAQSALFSVFLTIAGPGDEVIVLEPYYATYPAVVTAGGAEMVPVRTPAEAGYMPDLAEIEAALTDRTVAILLNSPGNPTGATVGADILADLTKLCVARGLWLVCDEVYAALTYDSAHVSAFADTAARGNVVLIESLSKSHAMTGWRIGWIVGPDRLAAALTDLAQAQQFGVTQFVQDAARVALEDTATPQRVRDIFQARRDALMAGLCKTDTLQFAEPQGGMFLMADVSRTGLDGMAFAHALLDEEAIAVVPGFGFGPSMNGFVRIGFLRDADELRDAGGRIAAFADRLERAVR